MNQSDPMTVKELAYTLKRSRSWVTSAKVAMNRAGIPWVMGMISLASFLTWVRVNNFRCTDYFKNRQKSPSLTKQN